MRNEVRRSHRKAGKTRLPPLLNPPSVGIRRWEPISSLLCGFPELTLVVYWIYLNEHDKAWLLIHGNAGESLLRNALRVPRHQSVLNHAVWEP